MTNVTLSGDQSAENASLKAENAKLRQAARDRVKTFAAERKKLIAEIESLKAGGKIVR